MPTTKPTFKEWTLDVKNTAFAKWDHTDFSQAFYRFPINVNAWNERNPAELANKIGEGKKQLDASEALFFFLKEAKEGDTVIGLKGKEKWIGKLIAKTIARSESVLIDVTIEWESRGGVYRITEVPNKLRSRSIEHFSGGRKSLKIQPKEVNKNTRLKRSVISFSKEEQASNGSEVTVFYGTNRAKTGNADFNSFYGGELADLSWGNCTISLPKNHEEGKLERPKNYWIYKQKENAAKHVLIQNIETLSEADFYRSIVAQFDAIDDTSALVFIHGYNNSFAEAARRAGQLAHDLPFNGTTAFFSWPSGGTVPDYLKDDAHARASIGAFETFLEQLVLNTGIEKLHLIAHSMGSLVCTNALNNLSKKASFSAQIKVIENIILAAPDIDQLDFQKNILPHFQHVGKRRTLYASKKDKALYASEVIRRGLPRLGDAGKQLFVSNGIDTIDASNVKSSGIHHSYVFEIKEVLTDLFYLFKDSFAPDKRRLKMKQKGKNNYWSFNK